MGKNDEAWEKLFEKYKILDKIKENGRFIISADQIKEFREPRLMTKFDHKINLPTLFEENNLSILPISRGDYIISSFSAYHPFEELSEEIEKVSIPAYVQSLMPQFLVSESIALNCANACGILNDFLEDEALVPTVNGRMSSGELYFNIDSAVGKQHIFVNNSQIEIDAAYEGVHYLSLFEAKRDLADDFLIRQLYYPFRVWSRRVTKTVKPIFFSFTLPITGITLGLFYPCLNLFVLKLTDWILGSHFQIYNIWVAFFIAILISLCNSLMEEFLIKPITRRLKKYE